MSNKDARSVEKGSCKISVIVPAKNRWEKIANLITSLKKSAFRLGWEVLIVDQSDNLKVRNMVRRMSETSSVYFAIRYFKISEANQSKALNFGIGKAKAALIAITHDDCIVDKFWVRNTYRYFMKNKNVACAFGKVIPFGKTKISGYICPSITTRNKEVHFSKPCNVWKNLGAGNNLAFRKKIIYKTHGFKEWLGVGSGLHCGEDQDFALELLRKGYLVAYNPRSKVWHDRWLKPSVSKMLNRKYDLGTYACYSYYLFKGIRINDFLYLGDIWKKFKKDFIKAYNQSVKDRRVHRYTWWGLLLRILGFRYVLYGYWIGFYHFLAEKFQ